MIYRSRKQELGSRRKSRKVKILILICGFIFCVVFIGFAQEQGSQPSEEKIQTAEESVRQEQQQEEKEEVESKNEVKIEVVANIKPDVEINLDFNSKTIPTPKIFAPSINLSGRGAHQDKAWPHHIADQQVLEIWQNEIGFNKGFYRLHWHFWDTHRGRKDIDKNLQQQIIANYESIIKRVSDAGGRVILCLYSMPAGYGRILDRRSPPASLKRWRLLVRNLVRYLSCEKKYNIWYEIWDAPNSDDFFLGLKKDYFNLYKFAALEIGYLEKRYRMNIPVGGPAVTWWFQNFGGNDIIKAEKSLIYEFIKYCRHYKLPLDFISWHAYSSDPSTEAEKTPYNKNVSQLIRDWLSFFNFNKDTPLIIDEWNYDSGGNIISERQDKSYIAASYIPARLKNMHLAGINYQALFSLEDFHNDKGAINNNRGVFFYDPESSKYKGGAKSLYNALLMLSRLGENLYKDINSANPFVDLLATKRKDEIIILIWNYVDPHIGTSYLSKNIVGLNEKNRASLLTMVESGSLDKILKQDIALKDISLPDKLRLLLKEAVLLNARARELSGRPANVKLTLLNLKGDYSYQRYAVDQSCVENCKFIPVEERDLLNLDTAYEELLQLDPYSVHLIILKQKPSAEQVEGEGG